MRIDNSGGYAFTPSDLRFASGGVVAQHGMAIRRATFPSSVPLDTGFELVQQHMDDIGRPLEALCGFELRSPAPQGWGKFDTFNDRYLAKLDAWNLLSADGTSPLARTNVAPHVGAPSQPGVLAFSYTTEVERHDPTFVVSGVAELMEPFRFPDDAVRFGETTPDALKEKSAAVVKVVGERLDALGVAWSDATDVHLYTGRDIAHVVKRELLAAIGVNPAHGLVWHDTVPPVSELELEIDVRSYAAVTRLSASSEG